MSYKSIVSLAIAAAFLATAGLALGVWGAFAVAKIAGWPILIKVEAILLGFGSAAMVGVFFRLQPAHKAARLQSSNFQKLVTRVSGGAFD